MGPLNSCSVGLLPSWKLGYSGPAVLGRLPLLAITGGIAWHFLQDQLAKSAVTALASLYGTKFKYGSIIKTICKWVHGLWG